MSKDSTLIQEIKENLKKNLKKKRYDHTFGVLDVAVHLAEKYSVDKEKVVLAALLHDYCKNMSREEWYYYIALYDIPMDGESWKYEELIHGNIARYIAQYQYHITDEDILNAIAYHTTGRKNMSTLEKVIALADYIEVNRDFPGVQQLRHLAEHDLEKALIKAMDGTIKYLIDQGVVIHKDTIEGRNFLIGQINLRSEVKK